MSPPPQKRKKKKKKKKKLQVHVLSVCASNLDLFDLTSYACVCGIGLAHCKIKAQEKKKETQSTQKVGL